MLRGSSLLSEFRTLLSKVLTLWHCVKVAQRYLFAKAAGGQYIISNLTNLFSKFESVDKFQLLTGEIKYDSNLSHKN